MTVLIGTAKGLRRCSKNLTMAENKQAAPTIKQATATKPEIIPIGSLIFSAITPKLKGAAKDKEDIKNKISK